MHHLSIDIETYSPEPIAKTGLYKYAQHPDFKILLFGYSLDGEPPIVIDMTQPGAALDYQLVQMLLDPNVQKHAYNAAFEWYCISRHFKADDQWTASWLPQWRCTMLQGQYCGYPAGLDTVGKALGLPTDKQKLTTGKALIKYFCTPCKPTKANGGRTRNLPQHDPAKWELFIDYNRQDVVTEMEVARRFASFPVPDAVQKQWELDQLINLRGVAVDLPLVDGALWCGQQARDEAIAEATQISGLDNPNTAENITIADGTASVLCTAEEIGADYNVPEATVTQMAVNVPGVSGVTNAAAGIGGADVESDEDLWTRYHERRTQTITSGNAGHYVMWAKETAGVSYALCVPLWNGNGTVKVVIGGADRGAVDDAIVAACAAHISAEKPIGATVTVVSAEEMVVPITAAITMTDGYTLEQVRAELSSDIGTLLASLPFAEAQSVPFSRFLACLLGCAGVSDYSAFTVNGASTALAVAAGKVPVLGEVTITATAVT